MFLKKRVNRGDSEGGGALRDLYGLFFKHLGIMHDAVSRQSPSELFMMLDSLEESGPADEYTGNDEYLRMFYGQ